MNLVFTICSNNYLAQAKTLMDSISELNPDLKIVIGLVDELLDEIDYSFFHPAVIIPVKRLGITDFAGLCERYNIIELNTSVKATFFKFLNKQFQCTKIIYFDPDVQVFHSLKSLLNCLDKADILLTPHILSPIPHDGLTPQENIFLNYGIYNLGFLALNMNSVNVLNFLDWWEDRTLTLGYIRVSEGLFVDQLWVNLVPLLFNKVHILRDYGYNMAPWNLHERAISQHSATNYRLNDGSELAFYHFSSYSFRNPYLICKDFYNRYSFKTRPDLRNLYSQYHQKLIQNKVEFFSDQVCQLIPIKSERQEDRYEHKMSSWITKAKDFIPPVVLKIFR